MERQASHWQQTNSLLLRSQLPTVSTWSISCKGGIKMDLLIWNRLGQQGAVVWHTARKVYCNIQRLKINKWQWPYIQANIRYLEYIWSETSWSDDFLDDSEEIPNFVAETAAAGLQRYTSSSICLCLLHNNSNNKNKMNGRKRSTFIYSD